jgi:arginase
MSGKTIEILLAPFDVERPDTPMARGARGLLERGLPERLREAGREVRITEIAAPEDAGKLQTVVAIARGIAAGVERAGAAERSPLILSGGCLASLGVVAGLQRRGREVAVVWIDAHGDGNTPATSPSGYWDGMALAALCGMSLPEVREGVGVSPLDGGAVVHLAGRSFDPEETGNLQRSGVGRVPPEGIAGEEAREILRRCAAGRALYLHVDVDGLDPRDAPAVGFPEPDGARLADLLRCREELPPAAALTFSALSFDRAEPEGAARTVAACARLALAFLT